MAEERTEFAALRLAMTGLKQIVETEGEPLSQLEAERVLAEIERLFDENEMIGYNCE